MLSRSPFAVALLGMFACSEKPAAQPAGSTATPTTAGPTAAPPGTSTSTPLATTSAPTAATVTPRTWTAKASGCGDTFLHIADTTGLAYLIVTGKRGMLGLKANGDRATVDLATENAGPSRVDVHVDLYPRTGGSGEYCTDYRSETIPHKSEVWSGESGKVTFTLVKFRNAHDFEVTVKLEGVVLKHPNGTTEKVPDLTYENVKVGWLPG